MNTVILLIQLAVLTGILIFLVLLWIRIGRTATVVQMPPEIDKRLDDQQRAITSFQSQLKEEFGISRSENAGTFRNQRQEIAGQINLVVNANEQRFELIRQGLASQLAGFQNDFTIRLETGASNSATAIREVSEFVRQQLTTTAAALAEGRQNVVRDQKEQTESLVEAFSALGERLQNAQTGFSRDLASKFAAVQELTENKLNHVRSELGANAYTMREETRQSLTTFGDGVRKNTMDMFNLQKSESEQLRALVEKRLESIQTDNGQKLEQMRQTVDEKLQGTLDARLSQSFQQVSERLEQVHRGLGEMQTLAIGVGDLKKMLTNVKSRGIWGEIQLGSLLEQTLAPGQFEKNVPTTGTSERVEFAIRLPGTTDSDSCVWLPIDSKFPMEDYLRLVDASERGDAGAVEQSSRDLEVALKLCARNIRERYIAPPMTTDFAILFLPTESLYAEAIRRDGLVDYIQREYRVIFAGPTTLSALLSSLRMGFRTLAIQKRSSEVWKVLGNVKTEFGKYADMLGKVKKKLDQASNSIEDAERKTRTIHRALGKVEEPPADDIPAILPEVSLLDSIAMVEEADKIEVEAGATV